MTDLKPDTRLRGRPDGNFVAPDAKVLVVDDIRTNLSVTVGFLDRYRCNVDTCTNGFTAVHMVQRKYYDMVFMDYMMPRMNGIETMHEIRALELKGHDYRGLPIIALTANTSQGAREMFLAEGFNDYISKPIEISKLNSVLRKWLPGEKQICDAVFEKPKPAPDSKPTATEPCPDLLRELAGACRQYRASAMEDILDRLETYRYENGGDSLVRWLRIQADNLEYEAIWKRLEELGLG
ncbi:MAG: response regulator [Treponema sp.]|nr:response regulator [Treponema sp.]